MSLSVPYMGMSQDGFMRLHGWYGFGSDPPDTAETGRGARFMDEVNATGAVLVGRRTA